MVTASEHTGEEATARRAGQSVGPDRGQRQQLRRASSPAVAANSWQDLGAAALEGTSDPPPADTTPSLLEEMTVPQATTYPSGAESDPGIQLPPTQQELLLRRRRTRQRRTHCESFSPLFDETFCRFF